MQIKISNKENKGFNIVNREKGPSEIYIKVNIRKINEKN